jgi:hypothetical protein
MAETRAYVETRNRVMLNVANTQGMKHIVCLF